MNITVFQHHPVAGAGLIRNFVHAKGWRIRRTIMPDDFAAVDLREIVDDPVIILGSPHSVTEMQLPWVRREREIVRELLRQGTRIFGICFGAQLIAAESQGEVKALSTAHTGWRPNALVTADVWRGPWFRWHEEHCQPGEDALRLATDAGTVQAFALATAVGVQFHPEVNAGTLRSWRTALYFNDDTGGRRHLLEAIDFAQRNSKDIEERAFALFEHVFAHQLSY